jgi:CRP-like cAMP-binding protein
MIDRTEFLSSLPQFFGMDPEEIGALADLFEEREFAAGETIYAAGDPGGDLLLVTEGAVEAVVTISEGVEKLVATVREGAIFGTVSYVDGQEQPVTARAVEATKALALSRASYDEFWNAHPRGAARLIWVLAGKISSDARLMAEEVRKNVEWTLRVSGAAALNLHTLISDKVQIALDLLSGRRIVGTLLKVEDSPGGTEITVSTPEGRIALVPYHAIEMLSLSEEAMPSSPDEPGEV